MDDLNQLTTVELQKILKDNGLPIYYQKKKDLIQRLVSAGLHSFNSKSRHNSASSSKSEDSVFLDLPEEKGKVTEQDLNSNLSEELIEKEINKKISVMTTEASIFSFKDIEESLEVFNGESGVNIISWLKEFEQIATVCNWGPVHKYLYSRRLLRGAARLAVEGSEQCNDFEELKQVLKSEFGSATSSLNIHRSLEARKKNSSESYLEYVFAMKQLASRGSIDERSLVSYIIQGIPDNPLNKSILYEATTICDLKKKLEAYKMMKEQMSTKSLSKHMSQSTFETKEKSGKSRCTNCGALSHSLIQCPHRSKGSRCFKCGEFGHIRAMCSKPESVTNNDKRSPEVNLVQLPLVKDIKLKYEKRLESTVEQEQQKLMKIQAELNSEWEEKMKQQEDKFRSNLARDWVSKSLYTDLKQKLESVQKRLCEAQNTIESLQENESERNKQLIDNEKDVRNLKKKLDEATLQASKAALERTKAMNDKLFLKAKLNELIKMMEKVEIEKRELTSKLAQVEKSNSLLHKKLTNYIDTTTGNNMSTNVNFTTNHNKTRKQSSTEGSETSHSEYTSEDVPMINNRHDFSAGAIVNNNNANDNRSLHRHENSSPGLGIESDVEGGNGTGRTSSVSGQRAVIGLLKPINVLSLDGRNNDLDKETLPESSNCDAFVDIVNNDIGGVWKRKTGNHRGPMICRMADCRNRIIITLLHFHLY